MKNKGMQILLKNRKCLILSIVIFILLPFFDMKNVGFTASAEAYLFRVMSHQIFTIIVMPIIIGLSFSEKNLRLIKEHLVVYSRGVKFILNEIYVSIISYNLFFFVVGQLLFTALNYIVTGKIYGRTMLVNIILVGFEIFTVATFLYTIRIKFTKNIFFYTFYYGFMFISLLINRASITIPLTIKIVSDPTFLYISWENPMMWGVRFLPCIIALISYLVVLENNSTI